MTRPLLDVYNDYDSFCTKLTQKLSVYAKFSSFGSSLMIERLFELLFMHFESLIEEIFISYALGNPSISGSVVNRTIMLTKEEDIIRLYSGGKDYPDWTKWDFILSCSKLFFNPSPFECLANYMSILNELKTIRNGLAHISGTAKKKYESLVRNRMGYYPTAGMKISSFLMTNIATGRPKTYFQEYIDTTRIVAQLVCT